MIAAALEAAVARIRARQGEPEIAHPVTLAKPPQFANLDKLALCQARRRALDARAEGQRLGDMLSAACGADDARLSVLRAEIIAAMDLRVADNARRDVAQAYREAGE
jgi:hypothetical protein